MRFFAAAYAIVLGSLVVACSQAQISDAAILGCTAYAKAMPVMTSLNRQNKLSETERKTVTYVRNTVGKEICEQPSPPTEAQLVELGIRSMVDGGVAALQKIEAAHK